MIGTSLRILALVVPVIILVTGTTGCTVLGAAVGTAFNSKPIVRSADYLEPNLMGQWIEVIDATGGRHVGTITAVGDEDFVIEPRGDVFQSAEPETLRREVVRSLAVGTGRQGTDRGMAIGATIDAVVLVYFFVSLSNINLQ